MVTCEIKLDGLLRGMAAANTCNGRTATESANVACYYVSKYAYAETPFVTPAKMDSELSVIGVPVIGKRGKVIKKKRYSAVPQAGNKPSFAALIVMARANPQSTYNALTKDRYALPPGTFSNLGKDERKALVAEYVDKMIKSRHSSGKFLAQGWIPCIQQAYKVAIYPGSIGTKLGGGRPPVENVNERLGRFTPAKRGQRAVASVENMVGAEGVLGVDYNNALHRYGTTPLQRAVDRVAANEMNYALKNMEKEVAAAVKQHWQ